MASKIFSSAERNFVKQLNVGKPTGVKVELGGIEIDLVPLTTQQGKDVVAMVERIQALQDNGSQMASTITISQAVSILRNEVDSVLDLARGLLWRSVVANQLVDQADNGKEVFDEWFDELDFQPLVVTLLPAVIKANGLASLLGNPSTPPTANAVEASESPADQPAEN